MTRPTPQASSNSTGCPAGDDRTASASAAQHLSPRRARLALRCFLRPHCSVRCERCPSSGVSATVPDFVARHECHSPIPSARAVFLWLLFTLADRMGRGRWVGPDDPGAPPQRPGFTALWPTADTTGGYGGRNRRCRMAPLRRSGRFPALRYPPQRRTGYTDLAGGPKALNPRGLGAKPPWRSSARVNKSQKKPQLHT